MKESIRYIDVVECASSSNTFCYACGVVSWAKSSHRLTLNQWFILNNFLVSNAFRSVSDKQTRTGKAIIKNCKWKSKELFQYIDIVECAFTLTRYCCACGVISWASSVKHCHTFCRYRTNTLRIYCFISASRSNFVIRIIEKHCVYFVL